jgi:glycosyltransferase involved in cell wall biosynthesis
VLPVALASGVPVVATDVGGLTEQLRGTGAGVLVPPQPAALAAAMARLLDPAEFARAAEAARAAGARLNDWESMADRLRDGIARVLRG